MQKYKKMNEQYYARYKKMNESSRIHNTFMNVWCVAQMGIVPAPKSGYEKKAPLHNPVVRPPQLNVVGVELDAVQTAQLVFAQNLYGITFGQNAFDIKNVVETLADGRQSIREIIASIVPHRLNVMHVGIPFGTDSLVNI